MSSSSAKDDDFFSLFSSSYKVPTEQKPTAVPPPAGSVSSPSVTSTKVILCPSCKQTNLLPPRLDPSAILQCTCGKKLRLAPPKEKTLSVIPSSAVDTSRDMISSSSFSSSLSSSVSSAVPSGSAFSSGGALVAWAPSTIVTTAGSASSRPQLAIGPAV